MTRVAVVDIGTNSTRLLVADVSPDGHGRRARPPLAPSRAWARESTLPGRSPTRRSSACCADARRLPRRRSTRHDCAPTSPCSPPPCATPPTAPSSPSACAREFALDARVLSGEEEAQLTFLGAMHDRALLARSPPSWSTSAGAPPSSSSGTTPPPASTSRCRPASCA